MLLAFLVYAKDKEAVVVRSAEDLKGITAKKIIWKKDGAKMVRIPYEVVTPTKTKPAIFDEFGDVVKPETVVPEGIRRLPFYMDESEVTVGQFKFFLKSSGYKPAAPIDWNQVYKYSPTDQHPMIMINWFSVTTYAKWAGKRLPTEKEWEFAARGGLQNKDYPWGDDESLARDYANYRGTGSKDKWDKQIAPVGSFKSNGYGLFDMAGNVWEWCQDWYDNEKDSKVLRGGSLISNTYNLRVANRTLNNPNTRFNSNGFRCVVDLP